MKSSFFSFYGSKFQASRRGRYPPPKHQTIIEPFAGSAGYSTQYHDHDIILYDINHNTVRLWEYLIKVTEQEILSLPDISAGSTVDDYDLTRPQKQLIGFWINGASVRPKRSPGRYNGWNVARREAIASQLPKIRHWKIHNQSYQMCQGPEPATWFIDPPYQEKGHYYPFTSGGIKYEELSQYCRGRKGQVIVCENEGANWLPFAPLYSMTGASNNRQVEVAYIADQ